MLWLSAALLVAALLIARLGDRVGVAATWAWPLVAMALIVPLAGGSQEEPTVTMPDVVGLDPYEADSQLRAVGLPVRALFRCLPGEEGVVASAFMSDGSPFIVETTELLDAAGPTIAGSAVPVGTTVHLRIPTAAACPGGVMPDTFSDVDDLRSGS